jgi:type VI secretion system secreted protein VgrG
MVYNGGQLPPHTLPDSKSRSYIRTRSLCGNGFNEVFWEDGRDKEELGLVAARDLTAAATHNLSVKVGNDVSLLVQKGNCDIRTENGKFVIEAAKGAEIKVGQNSICLGPQEITIKGLAIRILGQVQVEFEAPMVSGQAKGILKLKGGLLTLN